MEFAFALEQEEFRQEVKEFIKKEVTPELRAYTEGAARWIGAKEHIQGMGSPPGKEFVRKLGAKGWIGMSLPKKYGGHERPLMDEFILQEELLLAGLPYPLTGASMVAPTLLVVATEEMKQEYIPLIARGEIDFSLGYSEPEAGTDLSNIQTRAVRDGDEYIINGQKIFNTEAHSAEYMWLGARTNMDGPKHKGISLFIVPQQHPNISLSPMYTMGGGRTNIVYLDNVRVPATSLVGTEENKGFYQMMLAIDWERLVLCSCTLYVPVFLELIKYCKETKVGGQSMIEDPLIGQSLAELYVRFQICRLLLWRALWMVDNQIVPNYETAMLKVHQSDLQQRLAIAGMDITGHTGMLRHGSPLALTMQQIDLDLENMYRVCPHPVFAGGTMAVMKTIISSRGFGLPRAY